MSALARLRTRVAHLLALLFAAAVVLALSSDVLAQPANQLLWDGTDAFRSGILHNRHKLRPLRNVNDLEEDPKNTLLLVLGDTRLLDEPYGGVWKFLTAGGSLLWATDQWAAGYWSRNVGVTPVGLHVQIDPPSAGYRKSADCPFVRVLSGQRPPIFEGLNKIATNKPGYLRLTPENPEELKALKPLAGFPKGCGNRALGKFDPFEPVFAVAREWDGGGRVLVLADHSIFINQMILQPDNDNFEFADNCIRWLTGPGQRDRALLLEDGDIVSNFNVPLEEIGPPPLPSLDELVPRANTLLADLEKEDAFGQLFAGVSTTWLLRTLLIVFTLGLVTVGFMKLRRARAPTASKGHELAASFEDRGQRLTVMEERTRAMVSGDNLWEAARELARQFFGSFSESGEMKGPSSFRVNAGWRQRWTLRRRLLRLWRLAKDDRPSRVSRFEFRRLLKQIDDLKQAQARGVFRVAGPDRSKEFNRA
ncbi:MAG TPA: hypothetical protein VKI65_03580 [Gemmataceae bacterium]|nr:hypothetical protein [Gemmataceae bacterium]